MVDETSSDKPRRSSILVVTVCALLIRVSFAVAMSDSLNADPDTYRQIAENLRQNGIYASTSSPTAFRPPLYPTILAALAFRGEVTPLLTGGLNVLFGVATVVLTYLLAKQWRLGRWAFTAAALVAIDPILLHQSSLVMTETLASLLAIAGVFVLSRWTAQPTLGRAITAGVVFGLACLCRPTFIPWLGLSASLMSFQQFNLRPQPRSAITFLLSAAIVMSPWIARNYMVFGVPKATTTHGGYTLLLGNNPSFYRYLREAPRGTTWDSIELAEAWMLRGSSTSPEDALWTLRRDPSDITHTTKIVRTEFEDDKFAYSLARRYIADEPGMFVIACAVRIGRLWQLMPYRTSEDEATTRALLRIASCGWYSALFMLAIIALVHHRKDALRSPLVWGLLLCFAVTAVHAVYWSNMRMRAPLMPFICLLAAAGISCISNRISDRKP